MLFAPRRYEVLPQPIRDKVWGCLATRFEVPKKVVRAIVKLEKEITQFGKVRKGDDIMTGCHFVKKSEDTRDASFVRVESAFFLYKQFLRCSSTPYMSIATHATPEKHPITRKKIFLAN
jgi:hypothetical protein